MAKILITGIAGFIGSNLARAALAAGHTVSGFDNLTTGKRSNLDEIASKIEFREGSLLDLAFVRKACAGADYILHEAALPSVAKSVLDPVSSNENNVTGTMNLLVAARDANVKRVVYAGSSSAYGETPTLPKTESMTPAPISPYAVSKLTGEMYMQSFYKVYGLETVCLRYFNVFGPRQDPSSEYSGVLSRFAMQMLAGQQPTIFGDGKQSRDFTYIDNVTAANLLACTAPAERVAGKVLNVATGRRITLLEAYEAMQKLTGYRNGPAFGATRTGDIQHSEADIRLAKEALGYEPKVNFSEGLRQTVAWYREQHTNAAIV